MSAKKQPEINLLPQDKFAKTALGRLINWLLSTFRVIVILIEMVVMMAFLSRFWLDAKNSDLKDEMQEKQAIVEAFKDLEEGFNKWAQKARVFQNLSAAGNIHSSVLEKIVPQIPLDISLNNIAYTYDFYSFTGSSPSENSIQQLIVNLKSEKSFTAVSLTSLRQNAETGLLDFKIDFSLNKNQEGES